MVFWSRLALLALIFPLSANAYVRTMADSGIPLFWISPTFSVHANPANSSGLTQAQVGTELGAAFSNWSVSGTSANAQFNLNPGAPANSNFDGVNSAHFATASGRRMDYGVIAVTEVTYYLSNGQIAEADMAFNDYTYHFTDQVGDTGRTIGGKTAIYLRDVATHEAGHAFGLDHTIVNLSSLIYTAFSGQFTLSGDDQTAIRSVYPSASGLSAFTGYVTGRRGGIFGAHVQAIDLDSGQILAGNLASPDGSFRLGDLPAGQYAFLVEPFRSPVSSISSYFENVNHRFCSGQVFRRRFYGPCGSNQASVLDVRAGESISLGLITPSCNQMANPVGIPNSLANAGTIPAAGGARFGTMLQGETHYYRVNTGGALKARAISYSLYSPIDVKVDILDVNGNAIPGTVSVDNVESPRPGGLTNYDSRAEANLPQDDYVIRVSAASNRLFSSAFPAGNDLLDASGHYLVALSVNGQFGPAGPADMSGCVTVNNTSQSASYRAPASVRQNRDEGGGCGTLNGVSGPGTGGPGQALLAVAFLHAFFLLSRLKGVLVRKRR